MCIDVVMTMYLLGIITPLKYLSNFWRTLGMPLTNCESTLDLNWSENCVIAQHF